MRPALIAVALLIAPALGSADPARADAVKIFAAGSLAGAIPALVAASGLPAGAVAPPAFGPAGLLGERLEGGEPADLFFSADLHQPQRLAAERPAVTVVPFARNRMCLIGAGSLGLTPATALDRMLDPAVKLATSTPGSDPGGDYAQAVFARAEMLHPGAQATLQGKAEALFGGPTTMVPTDGHTPAGAILLGKRADMVLYYCSGGSAVLKEVPDSVSVPLPAALEPNPTNGLAVLSPNPDAMRLALFVLSAHGQDILAQNGLVPVAANDAPGVTVMAPGLPATTVSAAGLAALPASSLALPAENGGAAVPYAGPSLWSVLQGAGAVTPDFHRRVNQQVVVTGQDGYSVTLAMGEIDPEFENKGVILATTRDGNALPLPRLAIPGDKRLGRDVRDVATVVVR